MKTICQQYISDVKSFFPVIGKEERKYLAKLSTTVDEFCEEEHISAKESLYLDFGSPSDIVKTYYSNKDIDYLCTQMCVTKHIKQGILALVIIALIAVGLFGLRTYHTFQLYNEQHIYSEKAAG